jgi:hypothetical protein
MLTSAQLRSTVFDRLTGRLEPALPHPTSAAFTFQAWKDMLVNHKPTQRDIDLVAAAAYFGGALKNIRAGMVDGIFDELSGDQLVTFSIANANRGWAIFRSHLQDAMPADGGNPFHIPTMGLAGIPVGPGGALVDPNSANNSIIDALPYWFAEAAKSEAQTVEFTFDQTREFIHHAHSATNLQQTFKSYWQQVLWEPWAFIFNDTDAVLHPREEDDLARWRAWEWRDSTLVGQSSILSRNLEKDMKDLDLALPLTAVGITDVGIAVGPPDENTAAAHRSALENVRKSYAAAFLDEPLGGDPRLAAILLETAVCVLQDLVELRLPKGTDRGDLDDGNPLDLALAFPREQLTGLLQKTLGVEPDVAEVCIDRLSADPFGNLTPLFNIGLWHRPLVRSRDAQTIMIVAGALVWGSPIRRVERWLQEDVGTSDLSKTPAGIRYEAALRDALAEGIAANPLLVNVSTAVTSIAPGQAGEEIDLLLRIGSTVIVGEVKCLVGPGEPVDRHNHVRKLEAACQQASRKAQWLRDHPGELDARLGAGAGQCRVQPLVVINQSHGVEWEYGDTPVTDARFLELFVSQGEMIVAGLLYDEPGKPPEFFTRALYSDPAEAEEAIPGIFLEMPGMDPFRDSIAWEVTNTPLGDGKTLSTMVARYDIGAYVKTMNEMLGISGGDDDDR